MKKHGVILGALLFASLLFLPNAHAEIQFDDEIVVSLMHSLSNRSTHTVSHQGGILLAGEKNKEGYVAGFMTIAEKPKDYVVHGVPWALPAFALSLEEWTSTKEGRFIIINWTFMPSGVWRAVYETTSQWGGIRDIEEKHRVIFSPEIADRARFALRELCIKYPCSFGQLPVFPQPEQSLP